MGRWGRGSGRESTLRSININLGQLTHKAEYSTHRRELWASCSEGRASVPAPLCINYIHLWHPGVSWYCRFFFFNMFFLWNLLSCRPSFLSFSHWVLRLCLYFSDLSWCHDLKSFKWCYRESEAYYFFILFTFLGCSLKTCSYGMFSLSGHNHVS